MPHANRWGGRAKLFGVLVAAAALVSSTGLKAAGDDDWYMVDVKQSACDPIALFFNNARTPEDVAVALSSHGAAYAPVYRGDSIAELTDRNGVAPTMVVAKGTFTCKYVIGYLRRSDQ